MVGKRQKMRVLVWFTAQGRPGRPSRGVAAPAALPEQAHYRAGGSTGLGARSGNMARRSRGRMASSRGGDAPGPIRRSRGRGGPGGGAGGDRPERRLAPAPGGDRGRVLSLTMPPGASFLSLPLLSPRDLLRLRLRLLGPLRGATDPV